MEILNRAKELFDTASTMAGDFIYDQKCNIQIARVCADLKKEYERLGRLCYRRLKGIEVDENEFNSIVDKIEVLKLELNALREAKIEEAEFDSIVFEDGEPVDTDEE
jgi:hypothetical protein